MGRIKRILHLQTNGAFAEATRELDSLDAGWMLGPILAARYLHPNYHPNAGELIAWLSEYGDQPDSIAIASLLHRLAPSASAAEESRSREARERAMPKGAKHKQPANAIGALFRGNRDAAAVTAGRALLAAHGNAGSAEDYLAAGLAAWRQGDHANAGRFFAATYDAAATEMSRSAGAFWMARNQEFLRDPGERSLWLRRAAQETDTFYGRIAGRTLGVVHLCAPEPGARQTIGTADIDELSAIPRAQRAFGLLQIGDRRRAEEELRALSLDVATEPALQRSLMLIAQAIGFTQLAADLQAGNVADVAETPPRHVPLLHPVGGFVVDPTVVYGIVRHESNFHPNVTSSLGARGLMQIMPNTARGIGALPINQAGRLFDPGVNLLVGQRYLLALADDRQIDGDLLQLLAAYGQGQSAMRRWVDRVKDGGDPLMFIEAIPKPGVRAFILDALTASWRYAVALRLPAPSLDALAEGRYPKLMLSHGQPGLDAEAGCLPRAGRS